ncbi:hypothetical protein [Deinococcus sp. S9]|uniref:hypothetical protein n=1 Tax=Deinococcus sp. S9 TaxID=2545754 RepID=UPI001055E402|nr:hypothetical protein [Deinococcus sp. S9]TDE85582.1 hypothetical protein E0686_11260 [Deinococcus sp. S9]
MASRVGITAADVWQVALDGVPTYNLDGQRLPDAVIDGFIAAAENKVGIDLDVLIGVREVRCVADQGDPDDEEDDVIYHPALDKPRNWFAGDRAGLIKLPYRPLVKVLRVTVKPYGFGAQPLSVPLDRIRATKTSFSLVPGPQGFIFPLGTPLPSYFTVADGHRIPGGLEVVYTAGLGKRDLKQYPIIRTLILLQAALLCLQSINVKIGGGVQQEQVRSDGLDNQVALQKGEMGVLSGPLKALTASYNALLRTAQAALSGPVGVWLG